MPSNFLRTALIAILSVALARNARAETLTAARDQIVTGIVVVSAGIGVGVTLLVLHEKHKPGRITGCISAGPAGMDLTDESDKRVYSLAGDTSGAQAGERMSLEGKRRKDSGKMPIFEARRVIKDLGPCKQP